MNIKLGAKNQSGIFLGVILLLIGLGLVAFLVWFIIANDVNLNPSDNLNQSSSTDDKQVASSSEAQPTQNNTPAPPTGNVVDQTYSKLNSPLTTEIAPKLFQILTKLKYVCQLQKQDNQQMYDLVCTPNPNPNKFTLIGLAGYQSHHDLYADEPAFITETLTTCQTNPEQYELFRVLTDQKKYIIFAYIEATNSANFKDTSLHLQNALTTAQLTVSVFKYCDFLTRQAQAGAS